MRTALLIAFVALLVCAPLAPCQDDSDGEYFSPEQLDNLLAPIALYPDPLLAQVLLAATFPDQIDEAARFVRANNNPDYVDSETWDVSVKAVAHYPTVLDMMADKLDWTTALGQAYVSQSTDVMTSVQRLREQARSAGNLVTTPQQEIRDADGYIEIWPAEPRYIYVPVYDPGIVYFRRSGFFVGAMISFGRGFTIGTWLNHDFDWRDRRVYYHGWERGGGWVVRSRPYVRVTNVYVNTGFRNVVINRTVVNRTVNYTNLNRYHGVHRDVNYNSVRVNNRTVIRNRVVVDRDRPGVENKVIQRNINVHDSRIDAYRGRELERRQVDRPEPNRPEFNRQQPPRPEVNRPEVRRPERQDNSTFGGNRGGFDTHAASQRGQTSRTEVQRPERTPKTAGPPANRGQKESDSRNRDRRR